MMTVVRRNFEKQFLHYFLKQFLDYHRAGLPKQSQHYFLEQFLQCIIGAGLMVGTIVKQKLGLRSKQKRFNALLPGGSLDKFRRILDRSATYGGLAVGTTIDYAGSNINDMWRILGRSATDGGIAVGTFKPIDLNQGAALHARAAPEGPVSEAGCHAI